MTGTHGLVIMYLSLHLYQFRSITVSCPKEISADDFIIPWSDRQIRTLQNSIRHFWSLAVFCTWCDFHIYFIPNDGLYRSGVLKSVRDDMFICRPSDPLFRPEYKRICQEPLYQRYRYPATDDQSGDPTGTDGTVAYDRGYLYFIFTMLSPLLTILAVVIIFYHAEGYQQDWFQQWQIFHPSAFGMWLADVGFVERTNEWSCVVKFQPRR